MEEKRNIEITYSQAVEMYKAGGVQKELALQAFTEDELTERPLPRSWKEFCDRYRMTPNEYYITSFSTIDNIKAIVDRDEEDSRNVLPSEDDAKKHLALMQLHQLRDCYRGGWVPDYMSENEGYYTIVNHYWDYRVDYQVQLPGLLTFPAEEVAKAFLSNFRELIEQAGDLI